MRGTDIEPTGRARTGRILPGIAADRAFVDAMRGRRDNPVAQTIGRPDRPCRAIRLRNGAGNKDSVRNRDGLNDLHAPTTVAIASPPLADVTVSRWPLIPPVFRAFAECQALFSAGGVLTSPARHSARVG